MNKLLSIMIVSVITMSGISNVTYSASEVSGSGISSKDMEVETYTSYGVQCPNSTKTCGQWTYYSIPDNVSDFMANANGSSGYGSQASLLLSNGDYVRDIDTSTAESSEAYAQSWASTDHWYYAYYS